MNGKIVLIGTDAIEDRRATPFFTPFSGAKWSTPGVEIHANTVRTLLEQRYLLPVPTWVRALALLLAAGVTVWIATSLATSRAVAFLLIEFAAIAVVTHLLFEGGLILSTSETLVAASI